MIVSCLDYSGSLRGQRESSGVQPSKHSFWDIYFPRYYGTKAILPAGIYCIKNIFPSKSRACTFIYSTCVSWFFDVFGWNFSGMFKILIRVIVSMNFWLMPQKIFHVLWHFEVSRPQFLAKFGGLKTSNAIENILLRSKSKNWSIIIS